MREDEYKDTMLFKFSSFYALENNYLEQTCSYFPFTHILLFKTAVPPPLYKQTEKLPVHQNLYKFKSSLARFLLLLLKVLNLLASYVLEKPILVLTLLVSWLSGCACWTAELSWLSSSRP